MGRQKETETKEKGEVVGEMEMGERDGAMDRNGEEKRRNESRTDGDGKRAEGG